MHGLAHVLCFIHFVHENNSIDFIIVIIVLFFWVMLAQMYRWGLVHGVSCRGNQPGQVRDLHNRLVALTRNLPEAAAWNR